MSASAPCSLELRSSLRCGARSTASGRMRALASVGGSGNDRCEQRDADDYYQDNADRTGAALRVASPVVRRVEPEAPEGGELRVGQKPPTARACVPHEHRAVTATLYVELDLAVRDDGARLPHIDRCIGVETRVGGLVAGA